MFEQFIAYTIITLAVTTTLAFLQRGISKKVVQAADGAFHLRMNKLYFYLGWFALLSGLLVGVMLVYYSEFIIAVILIVLAFLLGLPLLLVYLNHSLIFDDENIQVRNYLGKSSSINWQDIQDMSFNHFTGYLTIKDKQGNKIKIFQHLVGLKEFMDTVKLKTHFSAENLKFPVSGEVNIDF